MHASSYLRIQVRLPLCPQTPIPKNSLNNTRPKPRQIGMSAIEININSDRAPHPTSSSVTTGIVLHHFLVMSGGTHGVSCWDDIIANASKVRQIRTIIDGMSRDIDGRRDIGYPVYGRGVTMISARNRLVQVDSGIQLQIWGVTVNQDDYVIADRCGTVFIPAERIEEVLDYDERIDRRQNIVVQAVRVGRPMTEVMHDTQFEAIREGTCQRPARKRW
ncbi:hypothetical protein N7497_011243 [Penicillium chrysogenum]|uniref:Protein DlpA n=2 Tax=Penicillium chrysogenum TaxID=5076 RepID=A0ABQ8W7M6_PENCH|nr:hypothetical protein N7505_009323 [Penicillium chrysogenum]KAJ6142144.1 hypothetical protein N7497_011243 [Penicillium chrysogenum]